MATRFTSVDGPDELIALIRRFPTDTLAGTFGTMPDGMLGAMSRRQGATLDANRATFRVDGNRYTLAVYDGAPESNSGWEVRPGLLLAEIDLSEETSTRPGRDPGEVRPDGLFATKPPSEGRRRSSDAMMIFTVLGLVIAVFALRKAS